MTFQITAPGIFLDVPVDDYFADPAPKPSLTQSIAKLLIDRSPAHARINHPRLAPLATEEDEEPEKYDAAKAIGNAAHALMIERGKSIAVADFPTWRGKDPQKFKEEAMAAGKVPILAKHYARAEAMVAAARTQLKAIGWDAAFQNGHGEVVIAAEENGLWFRALVDWLASVGDVYDFKSTSLSCAPHAIPKLMTDAGWEIQAAMIERILNRLVPEMAGRRKFRFIAQENDPPYALTPVELPEAALTMGRKKLDYAVKVWNVCMSYDEWPAYPLDICRPDYPGWKEQQWLGREIAEADRPLDRRLAGSLMGG